MRWHSVAVAALVLTAGCNAFAFSGSTSQPTATLTPVPVSTPGETRTVPDSGPAPPPGVSIDGSVDAGVLLAAHDASLDARDGSFTWVGRFELTVDDGNRSSMEYRREIEASGEAFALQHVTDSRLSAELYSTPSTGYRQSVQVGERKAEIVTDAWPPTEHTFTDDVVWQHFDGDVSVALVERDGQSFYRLHTTELGSDTDGTGVGTDGRETVSNYTATAYVTPEGLIRTAIVNYDETTGGLTRYLTIRFDYSAVGETTVARPDWVDWVVSQTSGQPPRTATLATPASTATSGPNATVAPPSNATPATPATTAILTATGE